MLRRVQESGGNYKLDLLSTPQQLDQVKTRTLMNLLNSSGFNPAEGDASRLFSRLARQGYLTSADVSGSSAP